MFMQFGERGIKDASRIKLKPRIVDQLRRLIREKGAELSNFKLTIKNVIIAKKWSLPRSIFCDRAF